jgi:hypothetical protein
MLSLVVLVPTRRGDLPEQEEETIKALNNVLPVLTDCFGQGN